ncbi:MAG: hypothetical protein V3U91_00230 [Candidatus Aminicenantaceae bacterium]
MKVAECFPDVQVQNRVKKNLRIIADYDWVLPVEREKAKEEIEAMLCALDLGHPGQASLQFRQVEDRMFFDYSNKGIRIVNSSGLQLKPLAKLSREPSANFIIRGPKHSWRFIPLDSYDKPVPAKVLKMAHEIQSLGFRWNESYIGEPHVPPAPTYTPAYRDIDPIFAVSIGRWILEVARW